jgi:hypothetical protein
MFRTVSLFARSGRSAATAARTSSSSRSASRTVMLHCSPNPSSSLTRSAAGRERASQTIDRTSAQPTRPAWNAAVRWGIVRRSRRRRPACAGPHPVSRVSIASRCSSDNPAERSAAATPLHVARQLDRSRLGRIQRPQGGLQRPELTPFGTAVLRGRSTSRSAACRSSRATSRTSSDDLPRHRCRSRRHASRASDGPADGRAASRTQPEAGWSVGAGVGGHATVYVR